MANRVFSALSLVLLASALLLFPVALSATLGDRANAACSPPGVVVVFIHPQTYTPDEAARRANAAYGYAVGKPRYAHDVHGLATGRYAEQW